MGGIQTKSSAAILLFTTVVDQKGLTDHPTSVQVASVPAATAAPGAPNAGALLYAYAEVQEEDTSATLVSFVAASMVGVREGHAILQKLKDVGVAAPVAAGQMNQKRSSQRHHHHTWISAGQGVGVVRAMLAS